jgi:hypothetical protein
MAFLLGINGTNRPVDVDGDTPLPWVLREAGTGNAMETLSTPRVRAGHLSSHQGSKSALWWVDATIASC